MQNYDIGKWEKEIDEFAEKTAAFYSGEVSKGEYKGYSGRFGSYSQKGAAASMIRLRMPAGCITKEKLRFVADTIKKYDINCLHFTTCQTIQLHNVEGGKVADILREALKNDIIVMGGGGDYPRNVMCSPLSGVEADEYFDVMPYAKAAGDYLLSFIDAEKMPRKLKVAFSNSKKNLPHATYRDLGFAAKEDGRFDVYSAGGLGNNPKFGVKVAEGVAPEKILFYIKAMWITFIENGNYESRAKARTRYMQDSLGGAEEYAKVYNANLRRVMESGEDLTIKVEPNIITKQGDGTTIDSKRAFAQKQKGLYTVAYHPIGGKPNVENFCALSDVIENMEGVELRLAPDETVYIVNLTGAEAERVISATPDSAKTEFETSVSCIGASICQVGLRDSQALLERCVEKVRQEGIADGALPQIHISGCPSSCGTHQTGVLGFRGAVKPIDKKPTETFVLFVNGCQREGEEKMGTELGMIKQTEIPDFLTELGKTVEESGLDFYAWNKANPDGVESIAQKYLV